MIKSVSVINYLGERLDLELAAPEKSGLWVKSIEGIGPGAATINVTSMASNDGGVFNSARSETRNITLDLGMYDFNINDDTWSIEKSRMLTYKYFAKKRPVTLIFNTDTRFAYIEGYVESNDPNIFDERESTSISIICPDPNFYDANGKIYTRLSRVIDEFEFPFSNESLSENLIEFGEIFSDIVQAIVYYTGEIETGINIKIKCMGGVSGFKMYNYETGEKIEILDNKLTSIVENGLSEGDEVNICTIRGKKSAKLIRQGVEYNILNSLGLNPDWFQIYYGDNIFTYTTNLGSGNVKIEISYENAYEGV